MGKEARLVREVRNLPMWNFNPENVLPLKPRTAPISTSFSNSFYVYPLSLEKSQYRNLAIKVRRGGGGRRKRMRGEASATAFMSIYFSLETSQ